MKLTPKLRRNVLIGGVIFGIVATPSFALFGIGDVVFDPTNYAELITQATTAYTHLKAFQANITHFSLKNQWMTDKFKLEHIPFRNVYGEMAGFDAAVTSNDPATAQAAWKNATVQLSSAALDYAGNVPGSSAAKSQLAMIEASDSSSPECLNATGAYRAAVAANAKAEQDLAAFQLDGSEDTNSEVEQLNMLNAAQSQHLVELEQQGMLHACLAQQLAVANMQQRNAAANDLNTWGFVQQQRQVNDANPTGGSATWTTYLP